MRHLLLGTKSSEDYKPDYHDIGVLCRVENSNLKHVLEYSINNTSRLNASIVNCDNKANSTIRFVLVVGAAFPLVLKQNIPSQFAVSALFILCLTLVLLSVFICSWCMFIRYYKGPPQTSGIIEWMKKEPEETLNERIIPSLIYSIAKSEYEQSLLFQKKIKLVRIGQALGIFATVCVCLSIAIVNLYF